MAFDKIGLDPTASGSKGSPKILSYTSSVDNLAAIKGANYFNSQQTLMNTGDMILVVDSTGASELLRIVNTSGVISLASQDVTA